MKKLFTLFISIAMCLTTIIGSFSGVAAENFDDANRVYFTQAEAYFSKSCDSSITSTLKQTDVGTNADADVQRLIWEISKTDADFAAKVTKIFDFWEEINLVGRLTNVYHPNADHTINEDDMVTTFTNDDTVAIFMYGNAMDASGNMSEENIGRCETVLALAQQYPNAYIILSGGHTQSDDKKHMNEPKYVPQYDSEAGASFKYLTQTALQPTYMDGTFIEGAQPVLEEKYIDASRPTIDPSRIILDECAQDTVGNIKYSMAKLEDYPQINKFIAVTSDYHIPRASVLLMDWIYLYGLDDSRGYSFEGFVGWANSKPKEETINQTISSQGSILKGYTGNSGSWSASKDALSLSTPETIKANPSGFFAVGSDDYSGLFSSVDVTFTSVEGFVYDAKERVTVEGFDKNKLGYQEFTVKYVYNGVTLTDTCTTIVVDNPQSITVTSMGNVQKGTKAPEELLKSASVIFKTNGAEAIDVTKFVKISNYNPNKLGYQKITVSLTLNNKTVSTTTYVNVVDEVSSQLIQEVCLYFANVSGMVFMDKTPQATIGQSTYADVERKLRELEKYDYDLGQTWRKVIEDWKELNAEDYINIYTPNADHTVNTKQMIDGIPQDATVAIFMYGNAMDASGNMSEENKGRCETVLALAQQYPNAYIILSGGHTQSDDKKHMNEPKYVPQYDSEAGASFKYLTQTALQPTYMDGTFIEGAQPVLEEKYIDASRPTIDPSRIILDECAQDTVGNITNSIYKLEAYPEIQYFVTVTSDYHIPRATLLLSAYINTRGLDYEIIDNLGYDIKPDKVEYIGMEVMSFAGIAGVSLGMSPTVPTISTPTSIDIKINGQSIEAAMSEEGFKGIEISKKDGFDKLAVIAEFENADEKQVTKGFSLDVTEHVEIIGYDEKETESQFVTFRYTYNGVTVEKDIRVINVEKTAAEIAAEKAAKEKAAAEKKLLELEASINAGNLTASELKKKVNNLQAVAADLQTQIETLKAEHEDKIASLEKENESRQGEIADLEKDIKAEAEKNAELQAKVEELNKQVESNKKTQTVLTCAIIAEAIAVAFVAIFKKKNVQ